MHLNPFVFQEHEADKLAILDILAEDESGRRFNIEVQRTNPGWLSERLTYYAATQLVEQIGEGDGYHLLRPSIGICILKAQFFPLHTAYHHEFRLRTLDGIDLTDCMEIHLLELPKYPRASDNKRVSEPLEQWMDFFQNAKGSDQSILRQRLDSQIFDEAIGVLEMISRSPEQRRYYQARLKWELDENTRRHAEEVARAALQAEAIAAKESGLAEGRQEGLAEGRQEGRVEGRAEQIRMLQELLGSAPTETATLLQMPLAALDDLVSELQNQLRSRLA